MIKSYSIVAATVLAVAVPSIAFAQMENGAAGSDAMSSGSMNGMKSKSSMMKKSKMMKHHSMHHSMKKPMSSGGGM